MELKPDILDSNNSRGFSDSLLCYALSKNLDQLRKLIGLKTVQIIKEIVQQSNDASSNYPQRSKIRKGIWLSEPHRKACHELKENKILNWLEEGDKGTNGFAPISYFERIKDGKIVLPMQFLAKKGVVPSEALEGALKGFTLANSAVVCQLAFYKTLLEVLGKEKFNLLFGKDGEPIKLGSSDEQQPLRLFTALTSSAKNKEEGEKGSRPICQGQLAKIKKIGENAVQSDLAICMDETLGKQKYIWLGSSSQGEEEIESHLHVDLSAAEDFKIDLLCDLIRMPLSKVNMQFVKAYKSLSSHNMALDWAKEVKSGSALPVSEFKSCIDEFLIQKLGQELFESNVAKVYIGGHPFVFIADCHLNPRFSNSLQPLIYEIDSLDPNKAALFLESQPRNATLEAPIFGDYLKGKSMKGLLFGIEDEKAEMAMFSKWIMLIARRRSINQFDFIYDLIRKPHCQTIWEKLKAEVVNKSIRQMILKIEDRIEKKMLRDPVEPDEKIWINLITAMLKMALKESSLTQEEKEITEKVIANPYDEEAFCAYMKTVNINRRDGHIVKNISSLVKTWPKTIESVIYMGYIHMEGVIKGLQKELEG